MKYQAHGHIYRIFETTERGASKFKVREFILRTDGKYAQMVKFQVTRDKCDELDHFEEDQTVLVHFNLNGREWTSPSGEVKYFNSLEAWKVENTEHPGDRDERKMRSAYDTARGQRDYDHAGLDSRDERGEEYDNLDIPF